MRAWLMQSYGGVDKLKLSEVDDPRPAAGQALLRMRYAALNPADAFLALAQYPAKPPLPHVLGRDGVGEVIALGDGVDNVKLGETVGLLRGETGVESWGTLAEKVAVDAAHLIPIPEGWSLEETAGAPLVYLTAWQALTQWTPLPAAGAVLLVTGASGGVGTASVLLAKSLGLTVVALSRSAEKGARLKELGADFVFDPTTRELRKQVLAALAPRRVDLVVDCVAGPLFNEVISMLGFGGRVSVVGRSGGPVPNFNTGTLFFRRTRIGGVSAADYAADEAQAAWRGVVERLNAMGRRPIVDRVFAFEQVKDGFVRLAQGPMGKVLIRVAD